MRRIPLTNSDHCDQKELEIRPSSQQTTINRRRERSLINTQMTSYKFTLPCGGPCGVLIAASIAVALFVGQQKLQPSGGGEAVKDQSRHLLAACPNLNDIITGTQHMSIWTKTNDNNHFMQMVATIGECHGPTCAACAAMNVQYSLTVQSAASGDCLQNLVTQMIEQMNANAPNACTTCASYAKYGE